MCLLTALIVPAPLLLLPESSPLPHSVQCSLLVMLGSASGGLLVAPGCTLPESCGVPLLLPLLVDLTLLRVAVSSWQAGCSCKAGAGTPKKAEGCPAVPQPALADEACLGRSSLTPI